MSNLKMPNYKDSIVNLACSMRKYFEIDYKHNTIKDIDDILESRQPKNVVVILYDGMGYNLLKRIIPGSFLDKHCIRSFSSVAPATTTASTTSMQTGLMPKEHGWLGWDLFFKEEDKIVTMFTNKLKDTEIDAAEYNVANKYYKFKSIVGSINDAGKYKGVFVSPYGGINYQTLDEMLAIIKNECAKPEKKYIYAYYTDPDSTMHEFGTDSEESKASFAKINKATEKMCSKLDDDTVVIIVADHGHINVSGVMLDDYPEFKKTLDGDIWIEGRLCAFKVKEENKFKELFNKYFGNDFELYSKEEVIKMNLFGEGEEHHLFRDSLGDYFALAYGDKYFRYCPNSTNLVSMHAGFTEDEMLIPLIVYHK
jgi:predicted AlkP superfamily pyrophosphatase or phosphodiesterase